MDEREFWRNERVAFLALTTLKGVGFWTLFKISELGMGFKNAIKSPEKSGLEKHFPSGRVNDEFQEALWGKGLELARELTAIGIQLHFRSEPGFPEKLKSIADPPHWIFVQGSSVNLTKPAVAVVGTRKPSDDGIFLARYAVAALSRLDCVTVSGLALGIDQVCHSESIRYKVPTIAVLGTGILNNYPKGSEELRRKILSAGGTVVSEYLPNQSYSSENFVRRNRLQAALCDVLIPAEWDVKSGTAHTVKYAGRCSKKIINIFLPRTEEGRQEIDFSRREYRALAFEIPFETQGFVDSIARELGQLDGVSPLESNRADQESCFESRDSLTEKAPDVVGNPDDPQLPLI